MLVKSSGTAKYLGWNAIFFKFERDKKFQKINKAIGRLANQNVWFHVWTLLSLLLIFQMGTPIFFADSISEEK